jgi:hypothetical protein
MPSSLPADTADNTNNNNVLCGNVYLANQTVLRCLSPMPPALLPQSLERLPAVLRQATCRTTACTATSLLPWPPSNWPVILACPQLHQLWPQFRRHLHAGLLLRHGSDDLRSGHAQVHMRGELPAQTAGFPLHSIGPSSGHVACGWERQCACNDCCCNSCKPAPLSVK